MVAGPPRERWQRVYRIAQNLLDTAPEERAALAARECGDDPSLLATVWDLVRRASDDGTFLEFSPFAPLERVASGCRIGPWRVVRELGAGGMGQVLLAERADGQYSTQAALKLVAGFATAELRERLRRERQILAGLEHPGIARLLDGGETEDGSPYFVMEYVDGRPLNQYRDEERPSLAARLRLFLEICATIEFAHSQLIVHRDLKPSNILITSDGRAKLLDFGIARLLDSLDGRADATIAAPRAMTIAYASPEQANGEPVATASDIYSLGVLLFELLSGHLPCPVKGMSVLEAVRTICQQEPARLSQFVPEARGDLDAILARALAKEPARRYPSARDLAHDIECFLADRPVQARPLSAAARAWRFSRRNLPQVLGSAAVMAAVLAGSAITLVQRDRANRRATEVRQLANEMISGYLVKLADLPGSTALRRQMADAASRSLDRLVDDAPGSAELAADAASAWIALADIQGAGQQYLGDFAGAHHSAERAIQLREKLLARSPADPMRRFQLAEAVRRLAAIDEYSQSANVEASAVRLLSMLDGLPPAWQSRQDVRESLAQALSFRAWVHSSKDEHALAIAAERRRLGVSEALVASMPGSLAASMRLADSHVRLSVYLFEDAQLDESVKEAHLGVDRLLASDGLAQRATPAEQRRYRFMLAAAWKGVGKPELRRGNFAAAAKALNEAGRGCAGLVGEDPGERRTTNCLEEALLWEGHALDAAHRAREAAAVADRYIATASAAFEATPPAEDADPFDLELWVQARDWQLPMTQAGRARLAVSLERLTRRRQAGQGGNGPRWDRWQAVAVAWKGR